MLVVTLVFLFGLVTLGAVVRATESGHDCPEWMGLAVETPRVPSGPVLGPLCGGDVSTGTFIELSHRVVAAMAALLVAWVVVLAWKHYRRQKWILLPAIISFLLILAQAGLGGAAVLTELPRWSVMSHLAMAQIVIAAVLAVYASSGVGAITGTVDGQAGQSNLGRWATAAAVASFALLMAGSYVANTPGAAGACLTSWPLCRGEVLPLDELSLVHMGHRIGAIVVGLLIVAVMAASWKMRETRPHMWAIAALAGVLFAAQVAAGGAHMWFNFAIPARVIHLSLATALWMSLTLLVLLTPGWFQQGIGPWTTQSRGDLSGAN